METTASGQPMTHREILKAFTGLLLALLVALLSSTIVSNALPTILADLHGSQSEYTWVVTATLLTSTATTPIWGKLSDLFSKKLLYQIAIVVFTVGSALGGIAQSMPELIAYRALQGIGLGGLQALIQVVIAAMIAPRDRGRYTGYTGAVFAVATVSGPLIGGLIVDSPLGWRWCFWVCVPLAVLAFVVLGRTLKLPVLKRKVRIDWLGATLLVGGVALLLIWVSLAGGSFGWVSWSSAAYVGGAIVALALAMFVETRVAEPVVPLRLFRNRTFTLSVLASLAVGTAMFGGSVFLGQYYQIARGFSPTHAGLMTLPMVLGLAVASTGAGQVISRTGRTKPFMIAGGISLLAGLFLLSTVDHATNLTLMGVYLALVGLGLGFLMQNLVLVVQNTVAMKDIGSSSSVVTFFRSLGGAAGVSALGAVLAARVATNIANSCRRWVFTRAARFPAGAARSPSRRSRRRCSRWCAGLRRRDWHGVLCRCLHRRGHLPRGAVHQGDTAAPDPRRGRDPGSDGGVDRSGNGGRSSGRDDLRAAWPGSRRGRSASVGCRADAYRHGGASGRRRPYGTYWRVRVVGEHCGRARPSRDSGFDAARGVDCAA